MKKRVLTVSLLLLACLCCCFSGFGSVKVFAAEIVGLANGNVIRYPAGSPICILVNSNGTAVYNGSGFFNEYAIGSTPLSNYSFDSPSVNASAIWFGHEEFNNNVVVNTELFDYYFIFLVTSNNSGFTFVPSNFRVQSFANGTPIVNLIDFSYTSYSDGNAKGFCCIGKMPDVNFSQFAYFNVNGSGALSEDIFISPFVYVTEKGSETSVESLISAINNQTGALQGSIDQAADDLQQSIEDQYQMEDEEDFGFSDIQQQYEEKMGVLTFGTETTIQMLELFSPSNAGEAYIRVPGWSMEVQGETYQIWDEYVFYFDSIEENFPFLVTTMRTFTVAMFYIAIVSYINKVYERNFLAK